jgi:hypothetical protein
MALDIEPELLARVQHAIEDIKNGKMVILVDDEDRENEGDLTLAADKVTPEAINFMAKYGRGLICLTLSEVARRPSARHGLHSEHRGARRRHDRHQRGRSRAHDSSRHPAERPPRRDRHSGTYLSAEGP